LVARIVRDDEVPGSSPGSPTTSTRSCTTGARVFVVAGRKPDLHKEAVRLRVEERLSLREIQERTGASKGSLSSWLRDHPLTVEEIRARRATQRRFVPERKPRGADGKFWKQARTLSPTGIARLSEAAVLFRLILHGFDVYKPAFDGSKADWLAVEPDSGRLLRIQVKTTKATRAESGLPLVEVTRRSGTGPRSPYTQTRLISSSGTTSELILPTSSRSQSSPASPEQLPSETMPPKHGRNSAAEPRSDRGLRCPISQTVMAM
jgi:hypothetical protein